MGYSSARKDLSLIKIFYKDNSVDILVYDINRKESFEEIQKYWYNQIKEFSQKI